MKKEMQGRTANTTVEMATTIVCCKLVIYKLTSDTVSKLNSGTVLIYFRY